MTPDASVAVALFLVLIVVGATLLMCHVVNLRGDRDEYKVIVAALRKRISKAKEELE